MLNYAIQEASEQIVEYVGIESLDVTIRYAARLPENANLRITYIAEWDNDDESLTRVPCTTLEQAKALNPRRVMYVFEYTWEG